MSIISKIVALSSALAFALQIALAMMMMRFFSPQEVGVFSVISQIGFFWTTLALAQTPLQMLANHGASILDDAHHAWISSMQRFAWLLPVATLAVWLSNLSIISALLWALLLSLCQLNWVLAQSMFLRMARPWTQASVRVIPPLIAFLVASAAVYTEWDGPALLTAALLGYATGATWLLPSIFVFYRVTYDKASIKQEETMVLSSLQDTSHVAIASASSDNRSAALRITHTLADAILATAIMMVWQRFYGTQETGWMAAPLRVMGFVPAVVHIAWAQVLLAQPQYARTNPLRVGLCGFAIVVLLGAGCVVALKMHWLGEQWQGIWPYLLLLVLWQGGACIVASLSHLPFLTRSAEKFSWLCIGVATLQLGALLAPVGCKTQPTATFHFFLFSSISIVGMGILIRYLLTQHRKMYTTAC